MAKSKAAVSVAYRKSSGRRVTRRLTAFPKGYGSLKGQFVIRRDIDITKPIYAQVLKGMKRGSRPKPK